MILVAHAALALGLLAPAGAATPAASSADRVILLLRGDPDYEKLAIPRERRTFPDAAQRLVVVHQGAPVLDLGMRDDVKMVEAARGGRTEEEGITDEAEVSADTRSAVILTTHYRRPVPSTAQEREAQDLSTARAAATEITWIDAKHPEARFTTPVEEGRWVNEVIPLPAGRGLALSTTGGLDQPADLTLIGADGKATPIVRDVEASVTELIATLNGAYLAIALAYPERGGLPDRGIVVLDLATSSRWSYTWSYGQEGEPVSWNLEETGVLVVKTPGAVLRFDKSGKPIGGKRPR